MIQLVSIPLLLVIFLQVSNFPQDFICLYRSFKQYKSIQTYNQKIDKLDETLREQGWLPKDEIEWLETMRKMDRFEPEERSPWPKDAWKYSHPSV